MIIPTNTERKEKKTKTKNQANNSQWLSLLLTPTNLTSKDTVRYNKSTNKMAHSLVQGRQRRIRLISTVSIFPEILFPGEATNKHPWRSNK